MHSVLQQLRTVHSVAGVGIRPLKMAEFGMKQSSSFSAQPGVEWYSGGAANQYANYQWAPPPTAPAATAYTSGFEDEAPLLEGKSCVVVCNNSIAL